jgi:tetratricopeptide (TPR) repeat protein
MMRWFFACFILLAPVAAQATPQYDVTAALLNLRAGRWQDAFRLLTRAIESKALKGAELADALEWRAFAHQWGGLANEPAALADLDAAIAAQPDNPLRYRARARLLMKRVDTWPAAWADINRLLATSPTDAENLTDACEVLVYLNRRAEAIEHCQRALRVDPEYARAREMLSKPWAR